MKSICGITAVRPYNIDPTATGKVAFNLAHLGLTVIPCDSAEQGFEEANNFTTFIVGK